MNYPQISFEFSQNLTSIQRSLYGYILSLLPHRSDAEDVLQETNLILCKKATEFDPKGHFQGWAFKIARFQVMRHITKNKRSRLHFSNDIIDSIPADDFDSEKVQLVQKALLKCYDLLPSHMRIIAKLRFREELNLKDISIQVQRPLGSISATLHRIRQNLSTCVHKKLSAYDKEVEF
jgi:RNA polymerase sigma-70 factor (ECF subfamily)